jgi:hypothetical protein
MTQPQQVDATFYAQVEPEWSSYVQADGQRRLKGAKVMRITQSRPARPVGGTVLVKLTLRLPTGAFLPLRPEAVVVIPDSLTEANPVEVIAEDPHRPADDGPAE